MNITVLCGSPRNNSNSMAYSEAFKAGAESAGHNVNIVNVGKMNIAGCKACEGCHTNGSGVCVVKDDMSLVWDALEHAEMVVLAGPVHYWSFSGQLQSVITRFYSKGKPAAMKYAMILSSGSPGVYDAMISQYNSIMKYWGAQDMATKMYSGDEQPGAYIEEVKAFGASI